MPEFLEANWSLLFLGALFVLMVRMHAGGHGGAHGGGCCGGHNHSRQQEDEAVQGQEQWSDAERVAAPVGRPAAQNRDRQQAGSCH